MHIVFILIVCYFVAQSNITTILGYIGVLLIIYIIYIKPFISFKPEPFKYNYVIYGITLTLLLFVFSKINFLESYQKMSSQGAAQIDVIINIFFQTYTIIYCLLVNLYFLLKNIAKFDFIKVEGFIKLFRKSVKEKLVDNFNGVKYLRSHKLLTDNNKIKIWILIIPIFLYESSISFISLIVFEIIMFLIDVTYNIFNTVINFVMKISSSNVSIIAIVFVYIVIQFSNDDTNFIFQSRIISTYEYISTAILIPIIFDGLSSIKNKLIITNEKYKKSYM